MDQVPKMTSLTRPERKVGNSHRNELSEWRPSGRPPKGYYSYKLEFGAEILRETPPTIVQETSTHKSRENFRMQISEQKVTRPLQRQAFHVQGLDTSGRFAPILWSEDVTVFVANGTPDRDETKHAYRHADADEMFFIHRTEEPFSILTDFGVLDEVQEGDFIYIPQGVTYTFCNEKDASIICYESENSIYRPYDYWMGDQQPWPFSPNAPNPPEPVSTESSPGLPDRLNSVILKRRRGDYTKMTYETPVFDAVAWEGTVWPFQLPLDEINALASPDFHVDPSKVTAFASEDEGMSIQVFLPRWMQSPPYNHMNQVEEALLNHRGYQARPEIQDGYLTLHPAGAPHGPDPDVVEKLAEEAPPEPSEIPWADEIGVMIETQEPFVPLDSGQTIEVEDYDSSWYEKYTSK